MTKNERRFWFFLLFPVFLFFFSFSFVCVLRLIWFVCLNFEERKKGKWFESERECAWVLGKRGDLGTGFSGVESRNEIFEGGICKYCESRSDKIEVTENTWQAVLWREARKSLWLWMMCRLLNGWVFYLLTKKNDCVDWIMFGVWTSNFIYYRIKS